MPNVMSVRERRREAARVGAVNEDLLVWAARIAVAAAFVLAWQYLPSIAWLRHHGRVFDPFFISSPSRVVPLIYHLGTGTGGQQSMWPALGQTLESTVLGFLIGTAAGAGFGLLLSNNRLTARILDPFVTVLNATPRIALIPIFILLAGATLLTSVLTAVSVVFFIVFYNAFNGGRSVPAQVLSNARLLGATPREILARIRLRYVTVWTLAAVPNAVSFGLISVVTTEMLTGNRGMGELLEVSISTVNSTLTFAVVIILTIVGVALVAITGMLKARLLHWSDDGHGLGVGI
jgi:NitT/TauT family transport system permease protein